VPDRPIPGALEQRTAPTAAAPTVEGRRLRGRVPYNVESRDLGGWSEIIAPGALAGAKLDDLIANVDHAGLPLGRHPDSIATEDRADGFHWSVEPPASRADIVEAVEMGLIRASSWRMIVAPGGDSWAGNVRTVNRIAELRDVSLVSAPAYPGALAEFRSSEPPQTPSAAPVPPIDNQQEPDVPDEPEVPTGGLLLEERAATEPTVESRVLEAVRSVRLGEARSLTTAANSARPVTPPEMSTFLWDLLKPSSVLLASGARVITTDSERVSWPRITAAVNPTWVAEAAVIPAGDPAFGSLEAVPKKLAHRTIVSNEVVDDSEPSIVEVLNAHLAQMMALKFDLAAFEGNPTTDPNSVRGLKFVSGVQSLSMGTNGATLSSYDPFVRAVAMLRASNVPPPYAIAAHPNVLLGLELLREATGSNLQLGAPAGLPPFFTTTQLSTSESKGTATNTSSAYIFAPSEIVVVRRMDSVIELDRSRLFAA
jgi:HK97 family phage major capsid protein